MKIILDVFFTDELKEYLLSQDGIVEVDLVDLDVFSQININCDKRIAPQIIINYINLFDNNEVPKIIEFDKKTESNFQVLKYTIKDMCCEYCYKSLVEKLFLNESVKSVKSNFDFNKPAFNIEFVIEYDKNYSEKELIKYINKK